MSHTRRDVGRKRKLAKRERVREWSKLRVATNEYWNARAKFACDMLNQMRAIYQACAKGAE